MYYLLSLPSGLLRGDSWGSDKSNLNDRVNPGSSILSFSDTKIQQRLTKFKALCQWHMPTSSQAQLKNQQKCNVRVIEGYFSNLIFDSPFSQMKVRFTDTDD